MTFEACLISAIVALAGAVTYLFFHIVKKTDAAAREARKMWDDAIARIRVLEDARVTDERAHGHELRALANEVLRESAANRQAHKQIADDNRSIMRELIATMNRCHENGATPNPQDMPQIGTEVLTRQEHG